MSNATIKAKAIHQSEVKPGMILLAHGYEYVVDIAKYYPPEQCKEMTCMATGLGVYRFKCHYNGLDTAAPQLVTLGQREDLTVSVKVA